MHTKYLSGNVEKETLGVLVIDGMIRKYALMKHDGGGVDLISLVRYGI
jgi:hypothetical protein